MLKYVETEVTFSEVPEEISLCINISNCPNHCKGCHSKHLWEDIGEELSINTLQDLIDTNKGISCIALMGGDNSIIDIIQLLKYIKENTKLKTCWYSGKINTEESVIKYLDYYKVGPYLESLGGLDNPKTNQRFFKIEDNKLIDITNKFWK